MRVRVLSVVVGLSAFVSAFGVKAAGQVNERVAETWGSPGSSSSIARGLRERRGRTAAADTSVVKFTPGVDSGVAKALADALGRDEQARAFTRAASHLALPLAALFVFPAVAFGQTGAKTAAHARDESQSAAVERGESEGMRVYALRLRPGQDLRRELEKFTKERGIKAGFVITTVGSLQKASLRLADQSDATGFEGKFEIVSLVGTLTQDGVHLHASISDSTGRTVGGHLVEGCLVYTTAEIVVGEATGMEFRRETDKATGYKELTIRPRARRRK